MHFGRRWIGGGVVASVRGECNATLARHRGIYDASAVRHHGLHVAWNGAEEFICFSDRPVPKEGDQPLPSARQTFGRSGEGKNFFVTLQLPALWQDRLAEPGGTCMTAEKARRMLMPIAPSLAPSIVFPRTSAISKGPCFGCGREPARGASPGRPYRTGLEPANPPSLASRMIRFFTDLESQTQKTKDKTSTPVTSYFGMRKSRSAGRRIKGSHG